MHIPGTMQSTMTNAISPFHRIFRFTQLELLSTENIMIYMMYARVASAM